jgi:outer membrane lipoprotein carrier protein
MHSNCREKCPDYSTKIKLLNYLTLFRSILQREYNVILLSLRPLNNLILNDLGIMKKLTTILFFLMISAPAIFAQSNGLGTNDPDAKKILDAVSAKFKTFKTVQSGFSLSIANSAGKVLGTKKGTVYMKGVDYRISMAGQDIFFDGTDIYTYDKAAKEITITKFDPAANSITPQKIFTDFYDKDFLYKLNDESTVAGKVLQEIELTPVDKTKPFFKVLLYIDKAAKTISSSKIFEKNGDRYTYAISNMKTNTPIADSQFTFDAKDYPGVEIVDLR